MGPVMNKYSLNLQWYLSRYTFVTGHVGRADLESRGQSSHTWIFLLRWGILTS